MGTQVTTEQDLSDSLTLIIDEPQCQQRSQAERERPLDCYREPRDKTTGLFLNVDGDGAAWWPVYLEDSQDVNQGVLPGASDNNRGQLLLHNGTPHWILKHSILSGDLLFEAALTVYRHDSRGIY